MNYYVLFTQTLKIEKVCQRMNKKQGIHAFIPRMETYIRKKDEVVLKMMFPGYLFIETTMNQEEFDILLNSLNEEKDGIIKELKKNEVSALTDDEVQLMYQLLNKQGIFKMSEGYKENGKTIITKGPLLSFQENIIDTNKRDQIAILDIKFLNRNIKAGLKIKQNS